MPQEASATYRNRQIIPIANRQTGETEFRSKGTSTTQWASCNFVNKGGGGGESKNGGSGETGEKGKWESSSPIDALPYLLTGYTFDELPGVTKVSFMMLNAAIFIALMPAAIEIAAISGTGFAVSTSATNLLEGQGTFYAARYPVKWITGNPLMEKIMLSIPGISWIFSNTGINKPETTKFQDFKKPCSEDDTTGVDF